MKSKPRYLYYNKPVTVCSTCFTIGNLHRYKYNRDFCIEHFYVHKCSVAANDVDGKGKHKDSN